MRSILINKLEKMIIMIEDLFVNWSSDSFTCLQFLVNVLQQLPDRAITSLIYREKILEEIENELKGHIGWTPTKNLEISSALQLIFVIAAHTEAINPTVASQIFKMIQQPFDEHFRNASVLNLIK